MTSRKPKPPRISYAMALIVGVPVVIWLGALYVALHFAWKYW